MSLASALIAVGIAFMLGLAILGGALGQGRSVAAALDSIGRNPQSADRMITPMLLGLSLIESLVILGWIMGFMLMNKMGCTARQRDAARGSCWISAIPASARCLMSSSG
jgi:F-type H+-transporting ATPase subunit c